MRSREGGKRQTLTATNKALSAPRRFQPSSCEKVITDQLVKKLGAWSLRGRAQGLVVLVSCLDRLPPS